MARFLNVCILLYFLALITASETQVIPIVSWFFFEFLYGIKTKFIRETLDAFIGKFPRNNNNRNFVSNKEVISELVKLGSMLEATSDTILREIRNSRAIVIHELYKNDLSQYINFVNDEYKMAFNFVFINNFNSTQSYAEKWIHYYGELRMNLKHIDGVTENYLRTIANTLRKNRLGCDLKISAQIQLLNEMVNIAIVVLKGYGVVEASMFYLNKTEYYDRNKTNVAIDAVSYQKIVYFQSCFTYPDRDPCKKVREQAECSVKQINRNCSSIIDSDIHYCYVKNFYLQGHYNSISYLEWHSEDGKKFNYGDPENCALAKPLMTSSLFTENPLFYGIYRKPDYRKSLICDCLKPAHVKKFCLGHYSGTSSDEVVTGTQLVEVNQVIFLRIQVGTLDENYMINEKTVVWLPSPTTCPESNLFEIKPNSSIILGDTYVPGQVVIGFHLGVMSDGLVLKVISRPMNKTLAKDLNSYEDQYEIALGVQREALDIQLGITYDDPIRMSNSYILKHTVYQSFIKESRIGSRTVNVGKIPAFMSKRKSSPVNVVPGTRLFFKASDFDKDLSQRLVPTIDIQPIEMQPHTAFSGAGFMFKKGDDDSGGYIALKLLDRDLTEDVDYFFSTNRKPKVHI